MERLNLDLWTFDPGAPMSGPEECVEAMIGRVISSWDDGADVVVFPEFSWMALERFVGGQSKTTDVARLFWNELFPPIEKHLSRPGKAAVLGTSPFLDESGNLRNRTPIISEGRHFYQDKIHLTPWEDAFRGGGRIRIWNFRGCRIAVLVCLDIEIPELSAALRGHGVDLLLVPSATENILGVERVHRCANARAVELGCHVGVCQLTGSAESDLIDENIGRLAVYSPSQSAFGGIERMAASECFHDGFHRLSTALDLAGLAASRATAGETNPSRIGARAVLIDHV